jgi:hypothetical protein
MQTWPAAPQAPTKTGRPSGPPRIFWIAQFIAAFIIGLPLIAYGFYCLSTGTFVIPYRYLSRLRGLELEHGAALFAAWACIVGGVGAMIHAGLTSIDRIKHVAASAARFAGGIALLLFIAALVAHAIK